MEKVEIYGEIKKETEQAILFFDGVTECWLPKSRIEILKEEEKKGQRLADIEIEEWMAYEKGLI